MENIHLKRRCDNIKTDLDYLIDELIAEIEDLEHQIDNLKDEIEQLKYR